MGGLGTTGWVLRVSNACLEEGRVGKEGLTILTVPSHELDTKVSFVV